MKKILFLTWDGPQVNYLEGLFLPIFIKLREEGFEFHIFQFTWGNNSQIKELCKAENISYSSINVCRNIKPFGEFLTILKSIPRIFKYIKNHSISTLMPRSIFPLLPCLIIKKAKNINIIYDADGFFLDEKVEFENWSEKSLNYKILSLIEKNGFYKSELILVRTLKAKNIIFEKNSGLVYDKINLISNGRNTALFKPTNNTIREKLKIELNQKVLIYVGSVGEKYCINEMLSFFKESLKTFNHIIILTKNVSYINDLIMIKYPELNNRVSVKSVENNDIPKYISSADLGLAFIKPTFSMKAVIPIKIGEYLLCGIPVLSTPNIGDTEEFITNEKCGHILSDFTIGAYSDALKWYNNYNVDPENLHKIGVKYYGLEISVNQYIKALNKINF